MISHPPQQPCAPATASGSGLNRLLRPRSVAVVGATDRHGSVGAAVVQNLLNDGFAGPISLINPSRSQVFGRPTQRNIGDAPAPVDLAVVCTPATTVAGVLRECGEAGVGGAVVLSAGFRECGPAGSELEERVRAELGQFPGMRVLGPNCVGLLTPAIGLNASFARGTAAAGGVAFLSQSGALCTAILGWAREKGIGFSHFISVGNTLDVGFGDLLDEMAVRTDVTAVVLYIEAVNDAPHFLTAARRCVRQKPVVVYKAGRNAASARAALSHTGALAGEDSVYQAAFDDTGIIRVERLDDLLATAQLLSCGSARGGCGPRLGVISNAGGPAVIAVDRLIAGKGELATLSNETIGALNAVLPPHWPHANPVDVIGDAPPSRIASAVEIMVSDSGVDAALVVVTPQAMTDMTETARAVVEAGAKSRKPIMAVWMGAGLAREGMEVLQAAGFPTYETPEQAVDAFMHLSAYTRRTSRHELIEPAPACQHTPHQPVPEEALLQNKSGTLSEADSKAIFSAYGIPVVATLTANSRDEAVATAQTLGYPVVLKVRSPSVSHKADVGGVRLNLNSAAAVGAAFDAIRESLATLRPEATFEGVTVQRMIDRALGVEVIVGARRDPTFGPIALVGAGGAAVEVFGDRGIALAPMSHGKAVALLQSLRISPMLGAFRGRPALDTDGLANIVVAIGQLLQDLECVQEAEANPILVTPGSAIALDARVVLRRADN